VSPAAKTSAISYPRKAGRQSMSWRVCTALVSLELPFWTSRVPGGCRELGRPRCTCEAAASATPLRESASGHSTWELIRRRLD
jgi:hypothetical protein